MQQLRDLRRVPDATAQLGQLYAALEYERKNGPPRRCDGYLRYGWFCILLHGMTYGPMSHMSDKIYLKMPQKPALPRKCFGTVNVRPWPCLR